MKTKLLKISILIILLILVRFFQRDLFYDPLLYYFKYSGYLKGFDFPEINWIKMTLNLLFRFGLNTVISLFMIHVIFENRSYVEFSIYLFSVLFIMLMPIYYYYIYIEFEGGYLTAFYIRRFIIQPLFVFLIIPALFYQKNQNYS